MKKNGTVILLLFLISRVAMSSSIMSVTHNSKYKDEWQFLILPTMVYNEDHTACITDIEIVWVCRHTIMVWSDRYDTSTISTSTRHWPSSTSWRLCQRKKHILFQNGTYLILFYCTHFKTNLCRSKFSVNLL